MKKSEMLDFIELELRDLLNEYAHVPYDEVYTKAKELLAGIEANGMLPPDYLKQESCGCCSFYVEHDWEPENE